MWHQDQLTVTSDLTVLTAVQKWFEQFCSNHLPDLADSKQQLHRLNLALAEGFTNAVRHAHSNLPSETPIEIQITLINDHIEIRIWDFGQPFDPNLLVEPEPGTLREGGYGWFLLRRLADQVTYQHEGDRNCLLIIKSLQINQGQIN
jgi:serine/threonine-protein kinase RsbW